jgi:hypothetical protein
MNPVRKSESKAPAKGAAPKKPAAKATPVKVEAPKAVAKKAPAAKAAPAKVEAPKAVAKKAPAAKAAPAKVEAPKSAVKKAAAVKAEAPAKKPSRKSGLREVFFEKFAPGSSSVAVAGEFSGWETIALSRSEDGVWRSVVLVAPGTYQYRLVFDGSWEADPERETVEGPHGLNNLLVVT